jgi:hypothetical protein
MALNSVDWQIETLKRNILDENLIADAPEPFF